MEIVLAQNFAEHVLNIILETMNSCFKENDSRDNSESDVEGNIAVHHNYKTLLLFVHAEG